LSISAASRILEGSGATRVSGIDDGMTSSRLGASRTSIGRLTNTGLGGGVMAVLMALRTTRSREAGSVTRLAHLVTGLAMATSLDFHGGGSD